MRMTVEQWRALLYIGRALDPVRGLPTPECGRLDHRLDEEQDGREGKLCKGLERRAEEAGILAGDMTVEEVLGA